MSVLIAVLIPDVLLIVAMLVFSANTKIGKEESKQPAGRRRQKFLVLG